MIHAVEELPHVALEDKAIARPVFGNRTRPTFQSIYASMGAEPDSTRKRRRDKRLFENGVDNREDCMMQYAVADSGLVNMSLLWVLNIKTGIRAMLVGLVFELAVKLEDILFEVPFERQHVPLVSFAALKDIPC